MHSDNLVAFINSVQGAWDPAWKDPHEDVTNLFYEALGNGLIQFLQAQQQRRLVTKSPSVLHLDRFFRLFPKARLVILVRDGRDVVSSCMQTFGWEFDRAARLWAAGAEEIHRFDLAADEQLRRSYRIVRYEDLVGDLRQTLQKLLLFLDLKPSLFDFEAAERLPVRGSSTYRGGRDRVHWTPVQKTDAFDPLQRWRSWSPDEHRRFAWLGGRQLGYFAYPPSAHSVEAGIPSAKHMVRDWIWHARATSRRIVNGEQRRLDKVQARLGHRRRLP